ncbi:hypothetical protein DN752_19685 [Echinicola strongylocentroti]|uniref:Uncharacterized protein n=1 Tax=Echinicola strongylocentroti TaxID=1795355 RepID=A0A2Z4IPA6_9BACT|nr:hypothetical protein [Echinicola strongylocentroti]AWW32183.1 hypothetical protein DN752_19685 [Echinicola strongylocentroti]
MAKATKRKLTSLEVFRINTGLEQITELRLDPLVGYDAVDNLEETSKPAKCHQKAMQLAFEKFAEKVTKNNGEEEMEVPLHKREEYVVYVEEINNKEVILPLTYLPKSVLVIKDGDKEVLLTGLYKLLKPIIT